MNRKHELTEPSDNTAEPVPPDLEPSGTGQSEAVRKSETFQFDILRCESVADSAARFQTYEVSVERNTTVLEALLMIQDKQDPSLAFRYSCRGAVCGSCAMCINGSPQLACRVQVQSLRNKPIVLEPLPGFEIIKDLVVNMDKFWERYQRIQPWLHAKVSAAEENRVSEAEQSELDQLVNCILCGICYAACPVNRMNPQFTGPAMLAKLYRFLADSRDERSPETLRQEDSSDGAWACHTVMACSKACPKEVGPADGIRSLRRKLISQRIKQALRIRADKQE